MPEYLSPGVYVEEIDAGPKPIEGVSTSTVGAVGVTARGPTTGKPELVTSFAEFVRKFGGFLPEPGSAIVNQWTGNPLEGGRWWLFPLAVKGFFDNGGQRMYVKRAVCRSAVEASAPLGRGMVSEIVRDASANSATLKLRHLIGIGRTRDGANVTLHIFRGDNGNQVGGNFTVAGYSPSALEVTLNAGVPEALSAKRGDFVEVYARTAAPVTPANTTVSFKAKSKGDWGNAVRVRVRPTADRSFRILADPVAGGSVVRTTLTEEAQAGAASIKVASVAGLSNGDHVQIAGREYVLSNVSIDPTTTLAAAANPADTNLTLAAVAGLANGDKVEIKGKEYTVSNLDIDGKTIDIDPAVPAGGAWAVGTEARKLPRAFEVVGSVPPGEGWAVGTTVQRLRPANVAGASRSINVWGPLGIYPGAIVELDNGADKEVFTVSGIAGDAVSLSGATARTYFEGHVLRMIEAQVSVRYAPEGSEPVQEDFSGLRLLQDGSSSNLVNYIKARSAFVEAVEGQAYSESSLASFPVGPNGAWLNLSGGNDNLAALSPDDFVGVDGGSGERTGIKALEDIDEISLCIAPGMWASTVHSALIEHCELLKDRFAILDSQDGLDIEGIRTFRETIDTKYAALYYPWIEVMDPSSRLNVVCAPSGHISGIYARVDSERGVHKAPGNEVIRGITRIAQDVTKREQDMLNPKGINALRFFPGRGNRVWGARTLSSDSAWKYVNVRRIFIFAEESIDEGTQWVVFEPNDESLWARVRQTISNFLHTLWLSGMLEGAKAEEAFYVKCDRSTMTQDQIDNGQLICIIGIAPVKPAEFVIFRIQQKTRETVSS